VRVDRHIVTYIFYTVLSFSMSFVFYLLLVCLLSCLFIVLSLMTIDFCNHILIDCVSYLNVSCGDVMDQ
jgi:hypothetical protein